MVVVPERLREEAAAPLSPSRSGLAELGAVVELLDVHGARRRRFDAELAEDALVEVLLDDLDAGRRRP